MMNLKLLAIIFTFGIATSSLGASKSEDSAKRSAEAWLALVDAGNAKESWWEADSHFKKEVHLKDWKLSLDAVRSSLGSPVSRKIKSVNFTDDSFAATFEFETVFAGNIQALEIVTPKLDGNGKWKISAYYIHCPLR